jgi:hypothetical protein
MLFYFRFTFASTLRGCPIPITDPHQSCGLTGLRSTIFGISALRNCLKVAGLRLQF